jgi:hypothetical protein
LIGKPIVRQTERSQRLSDSMNLLIPEYYLSRLRTDTVNVLGLHAKIEGLRYRDWLWTFFTEARRAGLVAYQGPVFKAAAHLRAILILFRFGFLSARSELTRSRFRHRLSASANLSIGLR